MSDHIVSLIRTYVPIFVGSLATWLFDTLGIILPDDATTGATVFLTGLLSAAYYAAVRWLEQRWPAAGVLLGSVKQPSYSGD